jgi:hypothetical protein
MNKNTPNCLAFDGAHRIASGSLAEVAVKVKEASDANPHAQILIFDALTSDRIEIDCRGSIADVLSRIPATTPEDPTNVEPPLPEAPAGPGRPRLGVVAREVTLLPRHWEWLGNQQGGASVALRKLVEQARRDSAFADRVRQAQNATDRFMSVMAGDLEGYEESSRALFASDRSRFEALIANWPSDIRDHLLQLAETVFQTEADQDVHHV